MVFSSSEVGTSLRQAMVQQEYKWLGCCCSGKPREQNETSGRSLNGDCCVGHEIEQAPREAASDYTHGMPVVFECLMPVGSMSWNRRGECSGLAGLVRYVSPYQAWYETVSVFDAAVSVGTSWQMWPYHRHKRRGDDRLVSSA